MSDPRPLSPRTLAAQALGTIDERTRAIVPPIHLATTFERDPDNLYRSGNSYGRPDNETVREAEAVISALEGAAATLVLGSGMSAAIALFLSLGPGAHVIAPKAMYWALRAWLTNEAPAFGISVDFVDAEDLQALAAALKPGTTRLVWLETPSNPLWGVSDIEGAARAAHAAGAVVAVDSTCATPVFTRPIALGADVVMHSATKYLNGHSDVLAGALCFARDDALCMRARKIRQSHGMILHPFEAFLLIRGLRTLDVRVRAAAANALELANRLSNHALCLRGALSGTPASPRPRDRAPADAGRLRGDAVDSRARRAQRRRSRLPPECGCGSGRPRLAGSSCSSSIALPSRARTRRVRPTCCGSPLESKMSRTSGAISTGRSASSA